MNNSAKALGNHLLYELLEADPKLLDDLPYIKRTLLSAAKKVEAIILSSYFHKFSPQGVTGIVSIAESHLAIHTWPEYNYAALDIFTCGSMDAGRAGDYVARSLGSQRTKITEIRRGLMPTSESITAYRSR